MEDKTGGELTQGRPLTGREKEELYQNVVLHGDEPAPIKSISNTSRPPSRRGFLAGLLGILGFAALGKLSNSEKLPDQASEPSLPGKPKSLQEFRTREEFSKEKAAKNRIESQEILKKIQPDP